MIKKKYFLRLNFKVLGVWSDLSGTYDLSPDSALLMQERQPDARKKLRDRKSNNW